MSVIFRFSSFLVLPFWGLMILLPRWRWTERIMRSPFVSVAPALFYVALVLPRLGMIWPAVGRPTLSGVAALLGSPEGATIAWIHFLAFDLFVGRWIYMDSRERRLSPLLAAPILFLTLMLGPLGFASYLLLRSIRTSPEGSTGTESASLAKERSASSLGKASPLDFKAEGSMKGVLREFSKTNWPLTFLGTVMVLVFFATFAGILLDRRIITGAPAWLKPAKFAISVSIYCFTFVWLLGFVEKRRRLARFAANVTALSLAVEMVVILTQAAGGMASHFNVTTPVNSFLWITMGSFIFAVWAMNLLLAVVLTFERISDRAFAWSLRLGLLVSLVGMAAAFLMVRPTPAQMAKMGAGTGPLIVGAHSVGVPDGGPGLPVVGWSTVGGDLRVPHFVGIHAMQLLPFVGWYIARRKTLSRFREVHRVALVFVTGFAYLGLVLLLVWQALRGQSLIHPDFATLAAGFVLLLLAGVSTGAIMARARREHANGSDFRGGRERMMLERESV